MNPATVRILTENNRFVANFLSSKTFNVKSRSLVNALRNELVGWPDKRIVAYRKDFFLRALDVHAVLESNGILACRWSIEDIYPGIIQLVHGGHLPGTHAARLPKRLIV